jgi:prepilin signal peptidase PulO-like enzyme (type II secretory pathway)
MIIDLILKAIVYIANDPFFWPAMGLTVTAGIFIGASIFDGSTSQLKKGVITLGFYMVLIMLVDLTRIIPKIPNASIENRHQAIAGVTTILIVTMFYFIGMLAGVLITKKVHHGKMDLDDFIREKFPNLIKEKRSDKVKK